MDGKEQIVQIRKKKGLQSIKSVGGGNLQPMVYHQENKNTETDGSPTGNYKSVGLPSTKQGICPHWNELSKQWAWGGTIEDLERLITRLKLKYRKGHPKEGQIISSEHAADRLYDFGDEVFTHPDFYGKKYMESGKISLNSEDPLDKFLYFCYAGSSFVDDKSKSQSKYLKAGMKYELVIPKEQELERSDEVTNKIEAIKLVSDVCKDEDRMRHICAIMQLPGYDMKTTTYKAMEVMLYDAANSEEIVARYDNRKKRVRFVELGTMPSEDIYRLYNIFLAKKNNFLSYRKTGYQAQGVELTGVMNDRDLIDYYSNPVNEEAYQQLLTTNRTVK